MVGVAVTAGEYGTFLHDRAVEFCHVFHLSGNVCVTGCAAVRHGFKANRRCMTSLAFGDLRVGIHPAISLPRLGIQSAGREHLTAAGKGKARGYEQSDKSGNDAGPCKTSKSAVIVHPDAYLSSVA